MLYGQKELCTRSQTMVANGDYFLKCIETSIRTMQYFLPNLPVSLNQIFLRYNLWSHAAADDNLVNVPNILYHWVPNMNRQMDPFRPRQDLLQLRLKDAVSCSIRGGHVGSLANTNSRQGVNGKIYLVKQVIQRFVAPQCANHKA